MEEYFGTDGNDVIDERTLAGVSRIYGLGGDDTIRSIQAGMIGGPGNDTLVALGIWAGAVYWYSPKGVVVDLQAGTAQDGYGTVDSLQNVHAVGGSRFDDRLYGTEADDVLHGHGGNDLIDGRGGVDTVQLIFTTPEGFTYRWDAAAGGLRVTDINPTDQSGNDGTLLLIDVERIDFGRTGGIVLVNQFRPSAWSVTARQTVDLGEANGSPKYAVGDFNGDGRMDLAFRFDPAAAYSTTTTGTSPIRMMLMDATGRLVSAPDLAAGTSPTLLGEMLTARLNKDRFDDLVVIATGQDPYQNGTAAPNAVYPGEAPYMLLGDSVAMRLVDRGGMPSTFGHDGAAGDIDGDGDVDLYVSSISEPARAPFFLLNDGSGSFTVDRTRLPTSVVTEQSPPLEVFADGSRKGWSANRYTSCTLVDVNGDGRSDLVVMGFNESGPSKVFLNDGSGHFSDGKVWVLPPGPYGDGVTYKTSPTSPNYAKGTVNLDTVALDFNGDGRMDLAVLSVFVDVGPTSTVNYRGNSVQLLMNTGTGFVDVTASRTDFPAALRDNADTQYQMLKAVDVDADGFTDLLVQSRSTDELLLPSNRILHNDGHGFFHDTALPVGLGAGLLIPIDPVQGRYASLHSYMYDNSQPGHGRFNAVVTSMEFDFSQGLDFFTGQPRVQADTLTSDLPGRWVHGTDGANAITLSSGSERAWGYDGNDWFAGLAGDDTLDGGNGIDVAAFGANRASATLRRSSGGWTVSSAADGTDTLMQIERLNFADSSVALDLDGNAGSVAKILGAVFGKAFVSRKDFVGVGLSLLDAGMNYPDLVALAVGTDLFAQLAGSHSNADFVNFVYKNVVGTMPSERALAEFVGLLDVGAQTQAALAQLACETDLNQLNIDLVGLASTGLEYTPAG